MPLDSSVLYEPALETAVQLARPYKASLHLVVVVPTASTLSAERAATGVLLPSSTRAILDLAEDGAVTYLRKKIESIEAQKIEVSAQVEHGDSAAKILEVTDKSSADLLVMTTHGRAGLDAFWSGSVAPKVLSRAHVPVLLLRVEGEEPVR